MTRFRRIALTVLAGGALLVGVLVGSALAGPEQRTIAAWVPLSQPAGGPYFGRLDPAAHYSVKIDNTGDGFEDVGYRWN
jgi:hypothetical protein